jgi:hypothetical protein
MFHRNPDCARRDRAHGDTPFQSPHFRIHEESEEASSRNAAVADEITY